MVVKQIEVCRQISVETALAGQAKPIKNSLLDVNILDVVEDQIALVVALDRRRGRRRGRVSGESGRRSETSEIWIW